MLPSPFRVVALCGVALLLLVALCACSEPVQHAPSDASQPQAAATAPDREAESAAPPEDPSAVTAPPPPSAPEEGTADVGATGEEDDPAPGGEDASLSDQEDGPLFLNCPRVGDSLYLLFEHDITFDAMGMASIRQTLAPQAVELRALQVTEDEQGHESVVVENNYAQVRSELNVYISGSAGTCTVEGSATLVPTITGYCQEGIVWLTVWEQWQGYEMMMSCDDGPPMPFQLPDTGYQHAGADGRGMDFWLVDGQPAVREEPFSGAGGAGAHRWSLYIDYLMLPVDDLSIEGWDGR